MQTQGGGDSTGMRSWSLSSGSFFVCVKEDYSHITIRSFARILQCLPGVCNRLYQLVFPYLDKNKTKENCSCMYYLIVELCTHGMYAIYFTFMILIADLFLVGNL